MVKERHRCPLVVEAREEFKMIFANLEKTERAGARESKWFLEARRGKNTDSPGSL